MRTLSNRDHQTTDLFLSAKANLILEIGFWKHLRYRIPEMDSEYGGKRRERWVGFEGLEEDRADDKNSGHHDEAQDHRHNKMTSDFITQEFQNFHIVKILPVPHEKPYFFSAV